MGALFELLAQILVALVTAAFAQMGAEGPAMLREQPSVQRTVVQNETRGARKPASAEADCPEQARLHTA